jgi:putative tryptophan/tyrosine transport system substrate-binding protein
MRLTAGRSQHETPRVHHVFTADLARPRRRADRMNRRNFITVLSGAAATWPLAAGAQQPGTPVIGFVSIRSADDVSSAPVDAFRQGLIEAGYVPGQHVAVEYRWAANQLDRLPTFATELVRRPVSVIAAMGTASAQAAKAASTTLPVVFLTADDPVKLGLVASLNRPGSNLTGVSFVSAMLGAKRLELLRTLVPKADLIAVLVDPNSAEGQNQSRGAEEAARALGQQVVLSMRRRGRSRDPLSQWCGEERVPSSSVAVRALAASGIELRHSALNTRCPPFSRLANILPQAA